jgi:hypothetical protein
MQAPPEEFPNPAANLPGPEAVMEDRGQGAASGTAAGAYRNVMENVRAKLFGEQSNHRSARRVRD